MNATSFTIPSRVEAELLRERPKIHERTCEHCKKHFHTAKRKAKYCSRSCRARGFPRPSLEARFWPRVDRRGPDECWNWTGAMGAKGYGQIIAAGKRCGAHRIAWQIANGREPGALFVCHSCDNPRCVNPAHLWLGTNQDNSRDRTLKGRSNNGWRSATHCIHGHEFSPENTYHNKRGNRNCKACAAARGRRGRRERREQRNEWLLRSAEQVRRWKAEDRSNGIEWEPLV